jgi:hypothetical protein
MRNKYLVWLNGTPEPFLDQFEWCRDEFGNLIRFSDYGNRQSPYGWEIDHRQPEALGGSDLLTNLRPLHHRANSTMGGILGGILSHV